MHNFYTIQEDLKYVNCAKKSFFEKKCVLAKKVGLFDNPFLHVGADVFFFFFFFYNKKN
jgi:hypothetical protein